MNDHSEKIKRAIAPIAQNNCSGSSELARRSAVALLDLFDDLEETDDSPLSLLRGPLIEFGRSLVKAQPKMAALFNLVNGAVLSINGAVAFGEGKLAAEKFVYDFLAVLVSGCADIARELSALVKEDAVLLIHSYSGTVNKSLIELQRSGGSFEVVCTESRPALEGRRTASVLSAAGIPVTMIADSGIGLLLDRVTAALMGADAFTIEGVVNKIGTAPIALASKAVGTPVYAVADTMKLLPPSYRMPSDKDRPSNEIWPNAPENISIVNRYFETVPLELFSSTVTESGVFDISQLRSRLAGLNASSELCEGL